MNNKRFSFYHYGSYHIGNSKFEELCAKNGDEGQIYISYYKSQYHSSHLFLFLFLFHSYFEKSILGICKLSKS